MRVRIVSDGTPYGTHVENLDTGERMEEVVKVEWTISMGRLAEATITLFRPVVDLLGEGEVTP